MSTYTIYNVEDKIISYFLKEWNNETVVVQENETPAWITDETGTEVDEWVRITVLNTVNAQDSFGQDANRRMLRVGRVFVQVFVRTGVLTSRLNELCAMVVSIFEKVKLSPLRIANIEEQGLPSDNVWFGRLINVLFQYDEIK